MRRASRPSSPLTSLLPTSSGSSSHGGRPPSRRTVGDVGEEDRRVNVGALVPELPLEQIAEHLRLEVRAGVRALDGAAAAVLGDGPVDDVAREHAGVALDLDEEQALAREEEQIDLVEAARRRVVELVQLPRLVRIGVREGRVLVDEVERLPLPRVGRRATAMDARLGERHTTSPHLCARSAAASGSASGETTAASSERSPRREAQRRRPAAGANDDGATARPEQHGREPGELAPRRRCRR